MRWAAASIVASLAWTACSLAGIDRPVNIEPGKDFNLKPGQSALAPGANWRVGFEGVTADSRCPKGERCVWAGDATVRVSLQQASGPKQMAELHTAQGAVQSVRMLGVEVRLLRLEPYPVSGKTLTSQDYVATLTVPLAPSPAAAAER